MKRITTSLSAVLTVSLAVLAAPAFAQVGPNLARGKPARQSSTAHDGQAARATDGRTDGAYQAGSVTRTAWGAGWLDVDLGAPVALGAVIVHNRTDCCGERLKDARVELAAEPCATPKPLASRVITVPQPKTVLDFTGTPPARYLCVRHTREEFLSVAELEAYAAVAPVKVAQGFYALVHQASGQALTIDGTADDTVARASARSDGASASQRFFLRPWHEGRTVISARTDQWNVLSSNASWASEPVRAWTWMTSPDQMWVVSAASDGLVRIRHVEKGLALALAGSKVVLTAEGDLWRLVPEARPEASASVSSAWGPPWQHEPMRFEIASRPGRYLMVTSRDGKLDAMAPGQAPRQGDFLLYPRYRKDCARDGVLCVGLESVRYPGFFVSQGGGSAVVLRRDDGSEDFLRSATFLYRSTVMGFVALYVDNPAATRDQALLESFERPGWFLRFCQGGVVLASAAATKLQGSRATCSPDPRDFWEEVALGVEPGRPGELRLACAGQGTLAGERCQCDYGYVNAPADPEACVAPGP
jgi:hypothetical protein